MRSPGRTHRASIIVALALAASVALGVLGAGGAGATGDSDAPDPPQIPKRFTWTGRYIVPDLDLEVPFTWTGDGAGNMQMVAGDATTAIHFTNLIHEGVLYTFTYEWPDIEQQPCAAVTEYTLDDLNAGLESARFVGPETLDRKTPRKVNHFRVGLVIEPPPGLLPEIPGVPIRLPVMSGDLYVGRDDPKKLWQLLQFGLQNLYDPEQDEWIFIDKVSSKPGKVELPDECAAVPAPPPTTPTTAAPS